MEDRRARHAAQKVAESGKDDIANFLFVDSPSSNIKYGRRTVRAIGRTLEPSQDINGAPLHADSLFVFGRYFQLEKLEFDQNSSCSCSSQREQLSSSEGEILFSPPLFCLSCTFLFRTLLSVSFLFQARTIYQVRGGILTNQTRH